ncbi:uncharacterized protein LOC112555759 [Pomacea canaliculata]|uniref:uncharacterized protein LOC112555759 n=1 Tax=Pomacea canaliculata TaxID=400727 RepID=UPI000D73E523|nr:uncharacterized protein LOC112555759 [Pomacea canaliculata]
MRSGVRVPHIMHRTRQRTASLWSSSSGDVTQTSLENEVSQQIQVTEPTPRGSSGRVRIQSSISTEGMAADTRSDRTLCSDRGILQTEASRVPQITSLDKMAETAKLHVEKKYDGN